MNQDAIHASNELRAIKKHLNEFITLDEQSKHSKTEIPQELISQIMSVEAYCDTSEHTLEQIDLAHQYLDVTSRQSFIAAAYKFGFINEWIASVFALIRASNYSFGDMLTQRAAELGAKPLFKYPTEDGFAEYSYENVLFTAREIAASFINLHNSEAAKAYDVKFEPRVAIFAENSPLTAMTDIACLAYGLPVFPLNANFDEETVADIAVKYRVNIVVTDSLERYELLLSVRDKSRQHFSIFLSNHEVLLHGKNTYYLNEYIVRLNSDEIDQILLKKPRKSVNSVNTVMFTSGSTGKPKGISFTDYNLVSKRFARAAALPMIGDSEVMLSYLPLFHTFGRFLEMMGTIFWRGTYVFTGNVSRSRLLKLFPQVEPTIFISIPLRWKEIYEEVEQRLGNNPNGDPTRELQEVTGTRLKWGLSAAGYLAPDIFRFFNKQGVMLSSGFGMTEATGGVTMTTPGDYIEGSVGRALPGVKTKLGESDELFIGGEYITRYSNEKMPNEIVPFDEEYWLPTGDVFYIDDSGQHFIIDRVKDIYKNNRGQTVSPKNVEDRFTDVPGFKRTFLLGDGKAYNSLLIVPDLEDDVMTTELAKDESDYIKRIITEVNKQLAPYERVVNFKILDRDFSAEKGELTPKGSYKRKQIAENFEHEIRKMYARDEKSYRFESFTVKVPHWFFRDVAILETDIEISSDGLYDKNRDLHLKIMALGAGLYQVGDFIYKISGDEFNLGIFAKNPYLWCGNPSLIQFSPYRDGWDARTENISHHATLPDEVSPVNEKIEISGITNLKLKELNEFIIEAIFSSDITKSIAALGEIRSRFRSSDAKIRRLIRLNLETMASHPDERIRCEAYKILLLEEPVPETEHTYHAFIESGKSFLNENSIKEIAESKLEKRRLESLRKRMHHYRENMVWPADEKVRNQFQSVFRLLSEFAIKNPQYYGSIRHEFSNWILHEADPLLSAHAANEFRRMSSQYESMIANEDAASLANVSELIVFDSDISTEQQQEISTALTEPGFLLQSVKLSLEFDEFNTDQIADRGIWVSRLRPTYDSSRYRVTIKLLSGMVLNLQLYINESTDLQNLETSFYHTSIAGYPFGTKSLPRLGTFRTRIKAKTLAFEDGLTLWEKICEINSRRIAGSRIYSQGDMERYFIEAMAAFFRCWKYSGERIIPGYNSPDNVIVPELDFREGATVLNIYGWKKAYDASALIDSFAEEFYLRTEHHYPRFTNDLDYAWIFDAYAEVFGDEKLVELLDRLIDNGARSIHSASRKLILGEARRYKSRLAEEFFKPLALKNAIRRFSNWQIQNPNATITAKENSIMEIRSLYSIDKYSDIIKFYFFRHTIFKDSSANVKRKFDLLLGKMVQNKNRGILDFKETHDLHTALESKVERQMFSRLLYPESTVVKASEVIRSGSDKSDRYILKSFIKDRHDSVFSFRHPLGPKEVGQLYRLFFVVKFPIEISDDDKLFVVLNDEERVIGGIIYKLTESNVVHIEGAVVMNSYSGRGLAKAMMNDFASRMASAGFKYIKGGYAGKEFYLRSGFSEDKRGGMLVRNLAEGEKIDILGNYCIIA